MYSVIISQMTMLIFTAMKYQNSLLDFARLEVFTAVLSKSQGFWKVMPCRLVDICRSFEKFHMTLSSSFKDVFIFRVHQNSPFICNERRRSQQSISFKIS